MLFKTSTLIAFALQLFSVIAAPVARDDNVKFIAYDLNLVKTNTLTNTTELYQKRGDGETLPLDNAEYLYTISLEIGSNKQPVYVQIDTGSSDLWVVDASQGGSPDGGVYDPSKSNTYHKTDEEFSITYQDQTGSSGYYVTDDIWLPDGSRIKQVQFGDTTKSSTAPGVLGIGFTSNEALDEGEVTYPNFPVALKNQGFINKLAYSIYLNKYSTSSGTIIFGGYDTTKHTGNFPKLPFISTRDLLIGVNTITIGGKQYSVNTGGVLDTGTTLTILPTSLYHKLGAALGKYDFWSGSYIWDCNQPTDKFVTYSFNGVDIKVSYADLSLEISPGRCQVGFDKWGGSEIILGDTFLRSAYVIFNLEDGYAQLGQAFYTDETNIVEI